MERSLAHNEMTNSKEYFSGTECQIYFNNYHVDEIVSIEYSMIENVQPVFGFHSYTFDTLARGNRYVQGQFSINYRHSRYLQDILKGLNNNIENNDSHVNQYHSLDINESSETRIQRLLLSEEGDSYNEYTDSLIHSFWGGMQYANGTVSENNLASQTYLADTYFLDGKNTDLHKAGFDITLTFNPEMGAADLTRRLNGISDETAVNYSERRILEAHITGISQSLNNDGNPIMEHFTFIAKDILKN